jgi:hypothetical protein
MLQVRLAVFFDLRLEAFTAIEFNEIFSGRQPRQNVKVFRLSETNSVPIFTVCWWFGRTKTADHTLKMGTELFPETSKNLDIVKRLSARENFTESSLMFRLEETKTFRQ